jgi:predicted enzyme related to lactoylglutathione lyase
VDLATSDVEASKAFYSNLFGWQADTNPDPQYGGYTTFSMDGKAVAGAGPLMMEGQPVAWSSYVIVDDAAATAAKATEAGGTVVAPPMEVPEQGTMAVFLDPTGAALGVWQPGGMQGAEVFNQPGSLSWNELATRDTDAAKAFYSAVFGWQPDESPSYTQFQLEGKSIAGMMPMGEMFPPETPAHWGVYFAVENCDEAVEAAIKAGGTVTMPPTDIPQGRFAGLVDPQGGSFYIISLAD